MGKVELDTRGAIEKEAPGLTLSQDQRKRDRRIEIVLQRRVARRWIDVPKNLVRSRLVQLTGPLAAAKIVLAG